MNKAKIIVLTPIRDEAWILEKFLLAASAVADHIILLDQLSEDNSREICARFPKAIVIANPDNDYSEAARSRLLIEAARSRFGAGHVLIAIDADEIIAGDSIGSATWETLRGLEVGTALFFEKPELLPSPPRCVRSAVWFQFGLVDDGTAHEGILIHSQRVPAKIGAPRYYAADIKILHFARLRPIEFAVRQAYYCMVENINASKSHRLRSCYYSPRRFGRFGLDNAEPCPNQWFVWFEAKGIDLWSFQSNRFTSFHKRVLLIFAEKGVGRFRWDDIWWEDWESARRYFLQKGVSGLPAEPILRPPTLVRAITTQLIRLYVFSSDLRSFAASVIGTAPFKVIHV